MESRMNRIVIVFAAVMLLAWPVQAQYGGHAANNGPAEPGPPKPKAQGYTGGSEGTAEDLQAEGRCDRAVPIFRRLTDGQNFAIARFHLGQCLLTLADATKDATSAADMRREGAKWILSSAATGFAQAEAAAVTICLDGVGMEKDPVEAEKWALVYRHNSLRLVLNLPDVASDVSDRIDAALTPASRAQAESRADSWTPATRSN
jgi:hypothetical protein